MASGFERREGVQDPNAQTQVKKADQLPVPSMGAPRAPNMSQIGSEQRKLAAVLGDAGKLLDDYVVKKQEEWKLEGQMMYAEGKTEEEIVASGNRYTTAGFMTMKARTAANSWFTQAMSDIDASDHQLSSAEYQKKLSATYKEMVGQTAGSDEFTRNLMAGIAENTFPQLVSQQVKSNNVWRENETAKSYSGMLFSEASRFNPDDPESVQNLQELVSMNPGLPEDVHRAKVTEAANAAIEMDNPNILKAMGVMAPVDKGGFNAAVSSVLQIEGGYVADDAGKGPTNFGINKTANPDVDIENLTSTKAKAIYKERYWNAIDAENLPANLRTIAFDAAVNQGVPWTKKALAKANGDPATFLQLRKERYAEIIANDPTKAKYANSWNARLETMTGYATGTPPSNVFDPSALIDQGFEVKDIVAMNKQYDAYTQRKSNKFDQTRILGEQAILAKVGGDGNLPAALDAIAKYKEENEYSDAWAETMANQAVTARNAYEKENGKTIEIQKANSTNTVAALSGEKQTKALELKRAEIASVVNTTQASLPEEERAEMIRTNYLDYLVKNNVVDKKMASVMEASLESALISKDGKINKEAVAAYYDYLTLANTANPGYASRYLSAGSKEIVAIAESLEGNMTSEQALTLAAQQVQRKRDDPNYSPPFIDPKQVAARVDKFIDSMDSGWFRTTKSRTNAVEVQDDELARAKADPRLKAILSDKAALYAALWGNVDAALNQATKDVQARAEYAVGNVLISGTGETIREAMGIAHDTSPTTVDKSIIEYVKENGEKMFGPAFERQQTQFFGNNPGQNHWLTGDVDFTPDRVRGAIRESISSNARGVPPMYISYNPDTKSFLIDLYANAEQTALRGDPVVIPATAIGDYAKKTILKPRSWYDLDAFNKGTK